MYAADSGRSSLQSGMTALAVVVLGCIGAAAGPLQQTPVTDATTFDAVTIRQNTLPAGPRYVRPLQGGRLEVRGMTLRDLIRFIHGPARFPAPGQFIGGPAWVGTQRFDIDALGKGDFTRPDPGAPGRPSQALLGMMQSMLESRFKLRARLGMQEQEHYVLTRAKPDALGPQLRPRASCVPQQPGVAPDPAQSCNVFTAGPGVITARAVPIDQLVAALGEFPAVARLVRNDTKLAGVYDMDVSWVPEFINLGGKQVPNPNASSGLNLTAAFEQQLGLTLEPRKGPVDVVFIDQAEMP